VMFIAKLPYPSNHQYSQVPTAPGTLCARMPDDVCNVASAKVLKLD
jgi:hypothetical protein